MTTTDFVTPTAATSAGVASAMPADGAAASARLLFADHMRVALTALVVIHHLTLAFVIPLPGSWYYEIPTINTAANLVGLFVVLID
jgi:hypothetical protein